MTVVIYYIFISVYCDLPQIFTSFHFIGAPNDLPASLIQNPNIFFHFLCSVRHYIGAPRHPCTNILAQGTSERQYIGAGVPQSANMVAQGCLGAPIN
jgi:hypothetical protein